MNQNKDHIYRTCLNCLCKDNDSGQAYVNPCELCSWYSNWELGVIENEV